MEKAGDILKGILKETKLSTAEKVSSLYTAWDRIAGEPLSHHTRVADIEGNKLIVEVEHPGWHQVLLFHAKEILRKVKKEYPSLKIKEIRIRYQAQEEATPAVQQAELIKQPEKQKKEKADEAFLRYIEDEKLRKSLENLYRGIVRKQSQG